MVATTTTPEPFHIKTFTRERLSGVEAIAACKSHHYVFVRGGRADGPGAVDWGVLSDVFTMHSGISQRKFVLVVVSPDIVSSHASLAQSVHAADAPLARFHVLLVGYTQGTLDALCRDEGAHIEDLVSLSSAEVV
ncbi:hypothetical protein SARC_00117 [Sphaeroforma arctica JP610]|uniref:Uncharacterized protein n=1 Tax=Sphaeroforma arctica JP610 TaxID=667725 RepID=A0A0L0GFK3_9EUKA|nr:hypothetical protein SARC_00117 [Sphaeroforma arctica JP610]KNC87860.1 hypothetical protein SARC_00117 [Sphaeroforma arctica JP610]|eukprot:XP_014161762.1 hypothetical protein SARC_00117 [Sphaeroforma arctica JP610]